MIYDFRYVDFATLYLYDFYEIPLKLKTADHHSPLFKTYNTDIQTQEEAVNFYISRGFPKDKLLLGLNTYGRSYLLFKNIKDISFKSILGKDVNRQGSLGDFTKTTGVLAFYEVINPIVYFLLITFVIGLVFFI
jgi:chitinase